MLHAGVRIGADGFGFFVDGDDIMRKKPQLLAVLLGDHVELGAGSCVDRGSWRDTVIGDHTKLDNLVQVGHNVQIGRGSLLCAHAALGGSSSLGECEAQSSASASASASLAATYAGIDDNEFCAHYSDGEAGWAADRCSATYPRVAACQVAYAPDPTDPCTPADAPPRPPPTPSTSPTPPPIPSPTAPPSPSTPSPLAPTNVPTPPPPPPRWPYVGDAEQAVSYTHLTLPTKA